MSQLAERSAVARGFALKELDPDVGEWLDGHRDAVDRDGDVVICAFGPNESAVTMLTEVAAYPHSVIIVSEIKDGLQAVGELMLEPADADDDDVNVTDDMTVRDVLKIMVDRSRTGPVALIAAGTRAVLTAAQTGVRGCELVAEALPMLDRGQPGRLARKLHDFDRESARYASVSTVRETRGRLRDLLAMQGTTMRIGITGHSNLAPETVPPVAASLAKVLGGAERPLIGVTCLARGADQVFARVVLELGGTVEVVLPATDYRDRKVKPDNVSEFDALIGRASTVRTLPFPQSNREAYLAASDEVLSSVEQMVAVWDGKPSDGRGGTADVVAAAHSRGLPVTLVWPEGAVRR